MNLKPEVIKFILRVGYYNRDENGFVSGYDFGEFSYIDQKDLFENLQEMQLMGLINYFDEIDLTHKFGYSTFEYCLSEKGENLVKDYNKLIDYLNNIPSDSVSKEQAIVAKREDNPHESIEWSKSDVVASEISSDSTSEQQVIEAKGDDSPPESTELSKSGADTSEISLDAKVVGQIKFLPISVNRDSRIKVGELELPLTPLYKTLYIFFFKHLEGVRLKNLSEYKTELEEIYKRLSRSDNNMKVLDNIKELVNPHSGSFSQKKSKINSIVSSTLDKTMVEYYKIIGERGGTFKIKLPAEFRDIKY